MVSPDALYRWQRVLNRLKEEYSPGQYKQWFADLTLYDATDSKLVIIATSNFNISALNGRYASAFSGVIALFFEKTMELEFLLPEQARERETITSEASLNPKYTFENFVVGSGNEMVQAAAFAVADMPGQSYNPLFIYGGTGLGKTHLLNAIGNYITADDPSKKVLFMTSEGIANELIDALVKKRGTSQLRNKMRNVDVLLVDDIQFLGKTNTTQEEFFHTFNDLFSKGSQIVLSSDRPPREIPTLEDRLRSRFEGGLTMDIGKPDYETRYAILKKKLEGTLIAVPDDVLRCIAENVDTNIRELEGALQRVTAIAQLNRKPITLETAKEALSNLIKDPKRITPELIASVVGEEYGVEAAEIFSAKRSRNIVEPRQIAIYITFKINNLSTLALGKAFNRDHSTIMHSISKVEDMIAAQPETERKISQLIERIRQQ